MTTNVRIRWLLLVLLLEGALFVALQSDAFLRRASLFRIAAPAQGMAGDILHRFSFENPASLNSWEEKIFKGKTRYEVIQNGGESYLSTSSRDASSGLYAKIATAVSPHLFLSWKWRAIAFPQKKEPLKLANRKEDDFAARLYVIFPGSNFFKSDVIEYIWDQNIPMNTAVSSPFSERVKLFVVRSGEAPTENEGWQTEERNIYEDYRRLFGRGQERAVGAIALMSDSDNTGTQSEADFGDILLKTKRSIYSKRRNES